MIFIVCGRVETSPSEVGLHIDETMRTREREREDYRTKDIE